MSTNPTEHRFQAEVAEVLSLVVNSLYTHKEVFLRELISNASDAIDQLDFRALTDASLAASSGGGTHRIDLVPDRTARTLTISDDGLGMDGDVTGTGLSIVRALVRDELHGRLALENDHGFRAEVVFPA